MTDWVEKGVESQAVVARRGKGADYLFSTPKTDQYQGFYSSLYGG